MKILVIDDEPDICEILKFNLETEGYEVDTANSAEEALKMQLKDYNLLLLDVMMGEMSGFQMARKMKADPELKNIPIIFITALDDEHDTVKGLNIGADDYIAKPLSIMEVEARVRAVLRRSNKSETKIEKPETEIVYENLKVNLESKTVKVRDENIELTKLEFEILALLLSNINKVFSREQLLQKCWPNDAYVMNRTVDVNITRLRKKILEYGKCIKTRVGYGYSFEI